MVSRKRIVAILTIVLQLLKLSVQTRFKKRRWYVRPINRERLFYGQFHKLVQDLETYDLEQYFMYFLMTPGRFHDLCQRIEPHLRRSGTHRCPIGTRERLALTLRLLATGDSQQSLAFAYMMGRSTVNTIFRETTKAIWDVLKEEYVPFPTKEGFEHIAQEFWRLWNFPLCLGAVDGKHVQIKCPKNQGSKFYNYKHTHSIVLMAAADANYRFTFVDIGAFGKQGDAGVFNNSGLGQELENQTLDLPPPANLPGTDTVLEHVFLGDEAFPLKTNMMRPFPGKDLTHKRRVYNYRHSRARRIIENAFGILAARWRILLNIIEASPDTADDIVKAYISLHNFLKHTDASNPPAARYSPANFTDYENADGTLVHGAWRAEANDIRGLTPFRFGANNFKRDAGQAREAFQDYFASEVGKLPWQDKVANDGKF